MESLEVVGKSVIREDAYQKVRGKTKYIADMKRVDMLYAKLVLSQKAHSNFTIDATKALAVKGVVAVFTYEDVPKEKYNAHNWYMGAGSLEDQYILSETARFVGDHLALVVGESKEAVEEGVRKVEIQYEELEPVIGLEEAKRDNKNLAFTKTLSCGDYEEAAKKADVLMITFASTQKVHHAAIEPHIAFSEWDDRDNLVVYSPCQVVHQIQYHICKLLTIPFTKVRVVKATMGGSFGGKGQTVLEPACAFASYKLKCPVMLYMDRSDTILGTRSRNASEMEIETALTKDGIILGRNIRCNIDGGAYYTNAAAIAMALAKKLFRLYRIENQICEVNTYYTNTIPGGACRGYGSPQAHAMTELNLDFAARELLLDPCELRLRNAVEPDDTDPTNGLSLGNARIKDCIQQGMEVFDWKNRLEKVKEKNTSRYSYGIGMACGAHGNGYKGAYPDFTNVDTVIYPDNSVIVKIGVHDQGCGTITTMQQIAAEALHASISDITVTEADTFITPYDSAGTQASRVTYVCGKAVQQAGENLLDKLKEACHILFEWDKDRIKFKNGAASYQKETYSYGQIALEYEKRCSRSMQVHLEYEPPTNPGTYACCFVEVKIDHYSGLTEVTDCLAVHDIGKAINPTLVEGQIAGGVQMSLGMALFEEYQLDAKGNLKGTNFSKYHIINAPDMPWVKTLLIEEYEPNGPYGGKSVGEIAAVAPAPAVVNAINAALGSQFSNYPVTPEKIVAFLSQS